MEQFLQDNGTTIGIIVFALAGGYVIFRKQINTAVFAAGKVFGAFLKRFKLDDEIEEVGQSFIDGMKSNDTKPVDTAALKADIEKKYPAPQIEPDNKG